jgi:hypothetical protein
MRYQKIILAALLALGLITAQAQTEPVPYRKRDKWGFAEKTGKPVVPALYDEVDFFKGRYAKVKKAGFWGLIRRDGTFFKPTEYDDIYFLNDTLMVLQKYGRQGLMTAKGRIILEMQYSHIYIDTDVPRLLRVLDVRGYTGLADMSGKFVLKPENFRWINGFQGQATAEARPNGLNDDNGPQGLVDTNGRIIISPKYYDIEQLYGKYYKCAARPTGANLPDNDRNYDGYLLLADDKPLTEPIYSDIYSIGEGLFEVTVRDAQGERELRGVIDSTGKEILPTKYTRISEFVNGIALACRFPIYFYGEDDDIHEAETEPADAEYFTGDTEKCAFIGLGGKIKLMGFAPESENFNEYGIAKVALTSENPNTQIQQFRLIDTTGKSLLPEYSDFRAGNNAMGDNNFKYDEPMAAKKGNKFYYVFTDGKLLTKDSFDYAQPFYNSDLATVGKYGDALTGRDMRYGLIDKRGKPVTPIKYHSIQDFGTFQEKLASVFVAKQENGRYVRYYGFIDKKGREVVPLKYGEIKPFHDQRLFQYGFAITSEPSANYSRKFGIIDSTGREVLPIQYAAIGEELNTVDSLVSILTRPDTINGQPQNRFGLFNPWTKFIIEPKFYDWIRFGNKTFAVVNVDGKYGTINKRGKTVIPPKYERLEQTETDGIFVFRRDKKYGAVNAKGEEIIPAEYERLLYIGDGLFKAMQNNEQWWAYVSVSGKRFYE